VNLRALIRHLRLCPFSLDSEEGRADERYRLALLTMLANVANRAVGMLVMVLSVSWTVPYLGAERFGAWMTVASFAAMLSFLDLGIGNALTNRVAHACSSEVDGVLRRIVSGGVGLLGILSLALAAILIGLASVLPWSSLIKLQSAELTLEIRSTVMVFGALFAVSIFTNGVARVFHGLQRGFEVHLAGVLGALVGLVALAFAVHAHAGLPILLLCSMGAPLLGNLGLWSILWLRGQFSPNGWVEAIRAETRTLLQVGGLFFLLQIGTMVGWGADSLIIANASGAASVAAFSVTQRLMRFVSQPLSIMNAPLWAAYADADARHDRIFVNRTFVRSIKLTLGFSVIGAVALVLLGQEIIELWTKAEVVTTFGLLSVMAFWLVLETTGNALGVLLNGLGIVRQQVWVVSAFVAVALPLKLCLAQWAGAFGVVLAGIVAYVLTTVLGYGLVFRRDVAERIA
jgi:O-antigen/teichoic acid export membrane protein